MFVLNSNKAEISALHERLRRVEALLEAVAERLEISPDDVLAARRRRIPPEVAELAAAGKKIQAIKVLREHDRSLDLASAKRAVEELQ